MNRLEITSIQRGCVYDGQGVRTTIFLKGCPFACPWCCNPETLNSSRSYFIDDEKCLLLHNIPSSLCRNCERNGGNTPVSTCPFGVYTPTSENISDVKELAEEVLKDKGLFAISGGGVTLSGGDPLLHADALIPFLKILSKENISCAVETTLYFKDCNRIRMLAPFIDEWIIDLKLQKENYRKDYLKMITNNLAVLHSFGKRIRFRLVYIESIDAKETVRNLISLGVTSLELIKCHGLSRSKYVKLNIPFIDYTPKEEAYLNFIERLSHTDIKVKSLKI